EKRIPRRSEPVGQKLAAIDRVADSESRAVEGLGKEDLLRIRMLKLALEIDVESALIVSWPGVLVAHLREECGHSAEVVLSPLLERMIMAARALDGDAEEKLAGDRRQVQLLLHERVVIGCARLIHVAGGGEQLASELVVRHVPGERVVQPPREDIGTLV